ncbi:carbohydrate ABC transporter permease [Lactococcus formosensis]|uniref:carbohydrate ABC transporter permease n=1 Tax=Lactococcus formosensis TaxID=1281486 RepID=UPI0013FE447B|nr:sugar ABC transporter permease [Lactococcus formosensis]NHI66942.1 sugar ABC transporter permease [Lactococcus garvieae]NHI72987.1 sugar ABC transporter permease [Lactococcus garvieae]NHI99277.1 sugar ABC transporter permease [Lactococcus garvieae]NHJ17414.1 sugar ABC transporter permease [Lactococcus garvieae]
MFKKKIKPSPEATYKEVWREGDIFTKLSFFIMGLAQLKNKQWLKGLSFLIIEIVFLFWLIFNGISSISLLSSLGHIKNKQVVFDEARQIYVTQQPDNSMLILLFGVMSLVLIAMVAVIYVTSLRSTRHLYALNRDGEHIPTTMEDLATLLDSRLHYTLMAIPLLGILVFTIAPLLFMITIAFTNFNQDHPIGFSWTGFASFGEILTGNIAGTFFPVLGWTLVWAVAATATTFFFGVLLALLIESSGIKFKAFWRTLFVIVMAVPSFVSLLMMNMFLDNNGPLNSWLQSIGLIDHPIPFLMDPLLAKFSVIGVNMWIGIPVSMLISTAIIQNLPTDQIEAAKIDGANSFDIFRSITFPQILFVMTPALIQQFIGNINNFNVIFLLTGGGPLNAEYFQAGSTDLLITWLYSLTMKSIPSYNIASAIGIVIFIISATASLFAYRRTNAFKEG